MNSYKISIIPLAVFFIFIVSLPQETFAQESRDSIIYQIKTIDGNEYIGRIIQQDENSISFFSEKLGNINIPLSLIKQIEEIDPGRLKLEGYWFDNPQATRYFWAPNGYGLKKGEGYYQNVWIFFNQFSVGITNNFSVGAGMVPGFLFGGSPTPIWITPKFSIPVVKDKFNIGVGALAATAVGTGEGGSEPVGLFYGTATIGSKDRNLSIGLGYGFAGSDFSQEPVFNLSGMVRITPRSYFLTENYLIGISDEPVGIIMLGGRSIIGSISLDYGGIVPLVKDMGTFVALPWLGINVPLNSGKGK